MRRVPLILPLLLWGIVPYPSSSFAQAPREPVHADVIAKIKEEGLERSQAMEIVSYLTDVHGPRLTGSPLTRIAGEWTKGKLTEWGLENAHLEPWGPFGRGWTLEEFTANMVEPNFSPLIAFPKAWSPSTPKTIRGAPIYLDAKTEKDLESYRGKLNRAIVMLSSPREVKALFDPPAKRQTDESLLALSNSAGQSFLGFQAVGPGSSAGPPAARGPASATGQSATGAESAASGQSQASAVATAIGPVATNEPATASGPSSPGGPGSSGRSSNGSPDPRSSFQLQSRKLQMAYEEGAAVLIESGRGDGGTMFIGSASLPSSRSSQSSGGSFSRRQSVWSKDAPEIIPQVVLAVEHYNRIVRMLQKGSPVELEIDIASQFYEDDLMSFNVIAEIPGSDLKDEIVMLGAHFDSWHSGTGATDNAVGCAVGLEAVRILQAIGAKPRRTIRIALWTGEEQGLLGSRAYVTDHFGSSQTPSRFGGPPERRPSQESAASSQQGEAKPAPGEVATSSEQPNSTSGAEQRAQSTRERSQPKYELKPDHEKFAGYFNLDNGTGKIRGIYLQNNDAMRPIFRAWLSPFASMGASTISQSNTGGTDHLSFDGVGLPGFQFIQDPLEYDTRTHHSSMDVYERVQQDDVKQASIIMASFVYHAAMRDEKLPRKPLIGEIVKPSTVQQ